MAFLSAYYPQPVVAGTTAGTYAAGNDLRLSDARTPLAHAASHALSGSDPINQLSFTDEGNTDTFTVGAGGQIGQFLCESKIDNGTFNYVRRASDNSLVGYCALIVRDDGSGAIESYTNTVKLDGSGGSAYAQVSGLKVVGDNTATIEGTFTANRSITIPDADGTLALTEQSEDIEITDATKGIILRDSNGVRRRLRIDTDGNPLTEVLP